MTRLSAVIIANNEGHQIATCIEALQKVTDDIVLVDSGSSDDTIEIAKSLGARVFEYGWKGYSQNKNFGNEQAHSNWILSIDADEILSEDLIESIHKLKFLENEVYEFDRANHFCGQWIKYCGWYPDWKVRIFNRKQVKWSGDFVHETLTIPVTFKRIRLTGKLLHYSYENDKDHLDRIERYSQLSAEKMLSKGEPINYVKMYGSPVFRFIRTYLLKLGFMDGKAGWTISKRNAYMVYKKYQKLKWLHQKNQL